MHLGLGWIHESPGGLERYQHGLCRALSKRGVETEAWVVGDPAAGASQGYKVRAFAAAGASRVEKRRGLLQGLSASMGDGGVLASHHATHAMMVRPLLDETPHVVHFHGPWALESQAAGEGFGRAWIKKQMERRVYRSADRLITLSQAFRRVLIDQYRADPRKVCVVPGGIDTDAFDSSVDRAEARRRLGWSADEPTLLTVRRLTPRMGLETLLEAMPRVLETHARVRLYIGGKGPMQAQLMSQIEAMGLQDRVTLLGFVPAEQLPLAYAAADLSVVPTRSLEGFGLVCLESLAAGTPVMVTPVGGLPEVVSDLNQDMVFGGSDANCIAEGLTRALSRPEELPNSAQCKRYVRDRFDWSVIAGQVQAVYRDAAEEFHRRRP